MKAALPFAIAATALLAARGARVVASHERPAAALERPYAPAPWAASILTLGYRELAADLLYVRLVGYFSDRASEPATSAALAESIVTLDPRFRRAWELGAIAMTDARREPEQALQLRAIAFLERAARQFPDRYSFPMLAGQIYVADLATDDPAQRRAWNERGALLLESASRKPNAPVALARDAALVQSKIGQRQRAIDGLKEILLITNDPRARREILDKLATLTTESSDELAAEIFEQRRRFERAWQSARPAVTPSMYLLIGPRPEPGFDLGELATGGRDLIGSEGFERLEPLTDDEPAPVPAP